MESTIMISPSEALRLKSAQAAPGSDPGAPSADLAEANFAGEQDPAETEIDGSKTEGNMIPAATSEYAIADVAGEDIDAGSGAPAAALDRSEQAHPEMPEIDDVPVPALLKEEVETPSREPSSPQAGAPEESSPPPELDAAESISKPADDLSQFEAYNTPSMFDSVRIMEPANLGGVTDIETRLQPSGPPADEPEASTGPPRPKTHDAAKDIPATSHNIGLIDTDGKRGTKLKPLSEGTILNGRYEIIRKIGGGGMGAVYLASDNNLGGVLRAVKEMVQTHIEEDQQEKAINDFKRESMILSSLDHVSIPTIYDYFYDEKESRFYLVMKYISGGDLSARLRSASEGRIDERTVCEWAVQIIDVLDYLHNQPSTIVYRDLKPSNIMIDGNSGRAMLIDFGIARSISQKEEKGVTAVGTMGYAPPELFSGNVEPRSDIYSLGSTMFHLLTGADPQSNPLLIFDFQKNPRPRQINPQLSDQIERILMKAVQYNADERFRSAAEMREVLEDHLVKLKAGIVTFGVGEVPASVSLANQSVFCGFCGQRIVATDMFCAFCGAKQPIAQQGVHVEIYGKHSSYTAKLVIEGTSELNAPAFSLQKDDNLLGRRDPMSNIFPEVDLSKYDPQTKISRRHARIWREGDRFLVEDLGSSNGTVLTRTSSESIRLTPRQPQVLAAGDRLRLGDATLHFVVG
jgi:eukaryotic-like serine/threonine-protein kinase